MPSTTATKTHAGGFQCLDGTRSNTPKKWKTCCASFESHLAECCLDIRYEWFGRGQWGIRIDDSAGGGYIRIKHCPHCGSKL